MTKNETVYLINQNLLYVTMFVNGKPIETLVDSGATLSIVNRQLVRPEDAFQGRPVCVQGYDGSRRKMEERTTLSLEYQNERLLADDLIMGDVGYDFLLSQLHMKAMHMYLFWDDRDAVADFTSLAANSEQQMMRQPKDAEDVPILYPELRCLSNRPPAVTGYAVPFVLLDTTFVRKKPYPMSRGKKAWLQK